MKKMNRRDFIKLGSGSLVAGVTSLGIPNIALGANKKVVVIGGGAGGAVAAKYIHRAGDIDVTLIEANKDHHTCFMSNEVIGGDRDIATIRHSYEGLKKHGINVVHSKATGVDPESKNGHYCKWRYLPVRPTRGLTWYRF